MTEAHPKTLVRPEACDPDRDPPHASRFALEGELTYSSAGPVALTLLRALPRSGGVLILNCAELVELDSVGVALLVRLQQVAQAQGAGVKLEQVREEVRERLKLYRIPPTRNAPPPPEGLLEGLGGTALRARETFYHLLILVADVTIELVLTLLRPWKMRWPLLIEQCIRVGSSAAGIVCLITFLVGLTLAFQSAYQLRQFGAAIYVAGLTAISMVREMGPLITAILVAGRSGSAITSEVATMRVNEELDALKMMGIPFVPFVAVPRVLALMLTLPLLTLMADGVGIVGGYLVGVYYLELSPLAYVRETANSLLLNDVLYSLAKALTFAWGIGLTGLYHGYSVEGGAQEVGQATTASVVNSIFFIIVATSVFSIVYYVILS